MSRRFRPCVRLLEDRWVPAGFLDATFNGSGAAAYPFDLGGATDDLAQDAAVQPDGKIVLGGFVRSAFSGDADFALLRLNPDGSPDTSFNGTGRVVIPFNLGSSNSDIGNAVAIQNDGKIVIVGTVATPSGSTDIGVARVNTNGSLDTTFSGDGLAFFDFQNAADSAQGVAIQDDGKIVIVGSSGEQLVVLRLNSDGSADPSFNTTGAVRVDFGSSFSRGRDVAVMRDGRLVAVGNAANPASTTGLNSDFAIVRLNPDGSLDSSFNKTGRAFLGFDLGGNNFDEATRVAVYPDGRILVGGSATVASGESGFDSNFAVARLTPEGAFDPTFAAGARVILDFNPDQPFDADRLTGLAIQNNGKIVLGGSTVVGVNSDFALFRLNDNGTLDTTFGLNGRNRHSFFLGGGDEFDTANALVLRTNGSIVLAGSSRVAGGTTSDFALAVFTGDPAYVLNDQVSAGVDRPSQPGVRVVNGAGDTILNFAPFDLGFSGGIRTATGDVNGDGVPDIIVGTGPGTPSIVRVIDGRTKAELFAVNPFEDTFLGGVYVAVGDVNGDGFADIAVSPDEGGGPRVRVFDGRTRNQLVDFFGIEDPNFRGGARVGFADINNDGLGDLLVAAGFGGGPRVAVFNGATLRRGFTPEKFFGDLLVFEPTLRNGVFITGGDLDGDGFAELIVGGGPGGGPRVFALSGRDLLNGNQVQRANFFAGDPNQRGGVRLTVKDIDRDGRAEIVSGAGQGFGTVVTIYAGKDIAADGTPPVFRAFEAFAGNFAGVFVG